MLDNFTAHKTLTFLLVPSNAVGVFFYALSPAPKA